MGDEIEVHAGEAEADDDPGQHQAATVGARGRNQPVKRDIDGCTETLTREKEGRNVIHDH